MNHRALFLADGSSDLPLARHLEHVCASFGHRVEVVPIPGERLYGVGRTVVARLQAILRQDPEFDLAIVHRDAELADVATRKEEVAFAIEESGFQGPWAAVVPVRMTESWLLLDPAAIREVAGRPHARNELDLPKAQDVEHVAKPKEILEEALAAASGLAGRRLRTFRRRFPMHRRLLLERLDVSGDVSRLQAWQQLKADVSAALARFE